MPSIARARTRHNPDKHDSPYRVQVLDRTLQVLDLLAETHDEVGPAELAKRLSLHRSTVHRLLMILERHRFVRKGAVEGKYSLGLKLFELGSRAVGQLNLPRRAEPFLRRLVQETRETAHLCVLSGTHMLSIVNVEGPSVLRIPSTVGRQTATHCTSVGKAAIAFLPDQALDDLIRRLSLTRYTRHTLVTPASLKAELLRVRKRGYAIDDEEIEEGLRCVGAPVRNYTGRVVAAVSIAGPVFRVTKERLPRLARAVVAAAHDLSAELGCREGYTNADGRGTVRKHA